MSEAADKTKLAGTFDYKLKADSGYVGEGSYRISPDQYADIIRVCEGSLKSDDVAADELEQKKANNRWDSISDFKSVLDLMFDNKWEWTKNFRCKYVGLRVDMRDGGCLLFDRNGVRISPQQLAYQFAPPKKGVDNGN